MTVQAELSIKAIPSTEKYQTVVMLLMVLGMYLPTSMGGAITWSLMAIAYLLVVCFYSYLFWTLGLDEDQFLLFSVPIVFVLISATFFSTLYVFGIGVLWVYVPVALLYSLRLRSLTFGRALRALFVACNLVNIGLGACAVFHVERVNGLVMSYYSNFFPDLVPGMLEFGKPVLTFATHSLAGFFIFLFFWLNFRTYLSTRRFAFLIFAVCYFTFDLCLLSVTGFGFALFAFAIMSVHFWRRNPRTVATALLAFFFLVPRIVHRLYSPIENWQDLVEIVSPAFTSPGEGFLGRYGSQGNNVSNLKYIAEHPFSPTGLTTAGNLFIGDSGPVEYLIRGSVLLLFLMYVGLFQFLRRNLAGKLDMYVLFLAILVMELGFTSLTYFRLMYLLPVAVIYLNSLPKPEAAALNRFGWRGADSGLDCHAGRA